MNPAIFIALFTPFYAVLLDKLFNGKMAEDHLLELSVIVAVTLLALWLFIAFIGGLAALFNRERDTYKELLEALCELQFELEVKTKKRKRYAPKMIGLQSRTVEIDDH